MMAALRALATKQRREEELNPDDSRHRVALFSGTPGPATVRSFPAPPSLFDHPRGMLMNDARRVLDGTSAHAVVELRALTCVLVATSDPPFSSRQAGGTWCAVTLRRKHQT